MDSVGTRITMDSGLIVRTWSILVALYMVYIDDVVVFADAA